MYSSALTLYILWKNRHYIGYLYYGYYYGIALKGYMSKKTKANLGDEDWVLVDDGFTVTPE
jgi:hypothetical protein